ncbi:MAG: DUF3857 domain-containing protein [Cytophagales bacterium]|nr:DUF3857 domain-containing protein [Bernardetiaceae bacterium]MDW8211728.1 DUF3857 domain-containing protein [Cytophagales bacterium]
MNGFILTPLGRQWITLVYVAGIWLAFPCKASAHAVSLCAHLSSNPAVLASKIANKPRVFENETYDWQEQRSTFGIPLNQHGSSAVVVTDRRVIEYVQESSGKIAIYETIHKIIKLNDRQAISEFSKVYIPVEESSHLILLKARTILPSGTIANVPLEEMRRLNNFHNRGSYVIFALEGLESGSEIEYLYHLRREPYFFGQVVFDTRLPIWNLEFEIITPEHLIFEAKSYHQFPPMRYLPLRYPGKNSLYARLQYFTHSAEEEASPLPMKVDFKLSYNRLESNEQLCTWTSVANMMRNIVYDFTLLGKAETERFRKLVEQITYNAHREEEKISAIVNYVRTHVRLEEQERLHESVAEVLEQRTAGKVDIVQLYAILFTLADISHRILITTDRTYTEFDSDFATPYALEEFIFHFTHSNYYFAPTHPEYSIGLIPAALQGNHALVVTPPFDEWEEVTTEQFIEKLPISSYTKSIDQNYLYLKLDAKAEKLFINWERTLSGHFATILRRLNWLNSAEEFKYLLCKTSQYYVPYSTILQIKWQDCDLPDNTPQVTLHTELQADGLLEQAGQTRLLRIGRMVETGVRNALPAYPFGRYHQIQMQIPEGWLVANMEELNRSIALYEEGTLYASFCSRAVLENSLLTITIEEKFPEIAVPEQLMPAYLKIKQAAASFGYVTLVIQKAG